MTINAVYEKGVFRPVEKLDLPDPCRVEVEIRRIQPEATGPSLDDIYAVLSKRFDSGEHDVAARHDEHQP